MEVRGGVEGRITFGRAPIGAVAAAWLPRRAVGERWAMEPLWVFGRVSWWMTDADGEDDVWREVGKSGRERERFLFD